MMCKPWSTQPVTGAQHDAWMAEEWDLTERRKQDTWPAWRDAAGGWHHDVHPYTAMIRKVSDFLPGSIIPIDGSVIATDRIQSCVSCEWSDSPHWHLVLS